MNRKSQIFDLNRFGLVLRRDLALNGRSLLLKALVMFGVIVMMLLFVAYVIDYHDKGCEPIGDVASDEIMVVFIFSALLFCSLGASDFMGDMSTPGNRLNSLMSPSSQFEKFVSRFIICIIGVTVAFFACFALADLVRVVVTRIFVWDAEGLEYLGPFGVMSHMAAEGEHDVMSPKSVFWSILLCNQASFVLGNTIWPKGSFVKTFAAYTVIQFIMAVVAIVSFRIFLGGHLQGYSVDLHPEDYKFGVSVISSAVWILFCLITSYFRMRESEIIQRF